MAELRAILALVLAVLVVAMAVPAAAALTIGLWLRRGLGGRRPIPSVIVVER
jgi:hypothetical protein